MTIHDDPRRQIIEKDLRFQPRSQPNDVRKTNDNHSGKTTWKKTKTIQTSGLGVLVRRWGKLSVQEEL